MTKRPFLVVYDYGQGGVWAYVKALSKDDILRRFLELQVVETRPEWMSEAHLARVRRTNTLDIDRPSGLLSDLLADRKGSSPRVSRPAP